MKQKIEWNPMSKKPPRGIYVLVADNCGRVHEAILSGIGLWKTARHGDFEVISWAHLPEHPEAGQEVAA